MFIISTSLLPHQKFPRCSIQHPDRAKFRIQATLVTISGVCGSFSRSRIYPPELTRDEFFVLSHQPIQLEHRYKAM